MIKTGGERGLLGLAFHPNYSSNGLFYVDYTRKGDGATVIAEYEVSGSPGDLQYGRPDERARGDDDRPALRQPQRRLDRLQRPIPVHRDGRWREWRRPRRSGAEHQKLLGKILRINPLDPDGAGSRRYSIPASNPFVGVAGRDEVWAFGLRNPWRCSFDGDDLWCGDVGQEKWEEVDRWSTGGVNLGWRLLEGRHYYKWSGRTKGALCTTNCKTKPIVEYSHSSFNGGHCAVTGGYVSRRSNAVLNGKYVFGDYCSGKVWAIPASYAGPTLATSHVLADTSYLISSFGVDNIGRIYLVDRGGGIYRLDES